MKVERETNGDMKSMLKYRFSDHMSNVLNVLYPEKDVRKGVIAFFVSLIVPEVLVLVDAIFKDLPTRSSFFSATPIVPETNPHEAWLLLAVGGFGGC